MHKFLSAAALPLVMLAASAAAVAGLDAVASTMPRPATFALVGTLGPDSYVMDSGLTVSDCVAAYQATRPLWGDRVGLACEREAAR